ncbi:NAD(P)H-dependent oxidoreductase [Pseudorhodoplanes sp.]|uniref:NAD(P)H-dependent oxidoreductase n=1 Tax=Pseudorhodoplanes sp. TaxID=1934341 RepID=UPI002C980B07|nr:NAD(P)H-dependent oxidoreductase [Pseudorhodoplanes sp.]HWV53348.1 NAD(P)H-dependent oxidoreductase [Pseudorhodoplanes sp.]
MASVTIIVGHPQRTTFCEALAEAYRRGAESSGHTVRVFKLAEMSFEPILREGYRREQPLEPDLKTAYDALAASDHWVLIFPLWCGDMPAILKGFIERILQPDLIKRQGTPNAMNWRIFEKKSARIIMTMAMPVSIYRYWYGPHALKLLRKNILNFIGVKPVRDTLFGMIADSSSEKRNGWLKTVETLGRGAE